MPYPTLSRDSAQNLADGLLALKGSAENPLFELMDEEEAGVEARTGPEYPAGRVSESSDELQNKLLPGITGEALWDAVSSDDEKADLEAAMAGPVHELLSQLPVGILHDHDFWRYLALFPFRWYLLAREPALKRASFGGFEETLGEDGTERTLGSDMKHQLMVRTYLWGGAACDPDTEDANPYERATALASIPAVIDFWHSHIVRVDIGHLDPMTRAFIDLTASEELSKNEARELAKMLTRAKNTVAFDTLSLEEASELVAEQLDLAKRRLSGD